MNKNSFAPTPPMGWNSYDYYDTAVTEADIKANADFMAANMKQAGWEYVVVDIEWYAYGAGSMRDRFQYIPFSELAMDEYSRLLPCPERFPSAAGGKGFAPLAEYVHNLGLKFGIHIMRGIPRQAAHAHTAILGTTDRANDIADPSNICFWNPDMYGVRTEREGAQAYYDSLMELYAQWGVDFIKCDDICRMDAASAREEIVMLHKAIEKCQRPIVLSLSPGPARIEEAWHYEKYANMWRITDDFWDDWNLLKDMFRRCELWQNHVSEGCYPDCDMLPMGRLGGGFADERETRFTYDEMKTMMTLWCIFRSPLMLGAKMTELDDRTLELLINEEVNGLLFHSKGAKQYERDDNHAIWVSKDTEDGSRYVALFNLMDEKQVIGFDSTMVGKDLQCSTVRDLWAHEDTVCMEQMYNTEIPAHGAVLYKII